MEKLRMAIITTVTMIQIQKEMPLVVGSEVGCCLLEGRCTADVEVEVDVDVDVDV